MNYFIVSLLEIPTSGQELQLKFSWKMSFFFFKKKKYKQPKTQWVRESLCAPTKLIWSLVNSSPYKLVNKYAYSLNFWQYLSCEDWARTLCALGRHARLFSRIELLLFVQIMSLNQCSHLLTKSRANKFIFKLLQNALTSDCLACAESPMSIWLVSQLKENWWIVKAARGFQEDFCELVHAAGFGFFFVCVFS